MWRKPKDHLTDSYFYKVDITGYSTKNKHKIVYPNLNSAMWPVPHTESLTIAFPLHNDIEVSDYDPDCPSSAAEENYVPDDKDFEPHKFSLAELNDFVIDVYPCQRIKLNCWHQD